MLIEAGYSFGFIIYQGRVLRSDYRCTATTNHPSTRFTSTYPCCMFAGSLLEKWNIRAQQGTCGDYLKRSILLLKAEVEGGGSFVSAVQSDDSGGDGDLNIAFLFNDQYSEHILGMNKSAMCTRCTSQSRLRVHFGKSRVDI